MGPRRGFTWNGPPVTAPPPPAGLEGGLAHLVAALRDSPHGLVSPRARQELESRHIPECLALAEMLPPVSPVGATGGGRPHLVDVGAGGGLPGLVVALRRPDLRICLVEASGRKARFLDRVALELGLADVEVHHGRAEELGRGRLATAFDLATARAVAPLPRLLEVALPLLRPGGHLYAVKGRAWAQELAEAHRVGPTGWEVVATPDTAPGAGCRARAPRVVILSRGV